MNHELIVSFRSTSRLSVRYSLNMMLVAFASYLTNTLEKCEISDVMKTHKTCAQGGALFQKECNSRPVLTLLYVNTSKYGQVCSS